MCRETLSWYFRAVSWAGLKPGAAKRSSAHVPVAAGAGAGAARGALAVRCRAAGEFFLCWFRQGQELVGTRGTRRVRCGGMLSGCLGSVPLENQTVPIWLSNSKYLLPSAEVLHNNLLLKQT